MYTQVLRFVNFRGNPALISVCKNVFSRYQVATITSKVFRDHSVKKPEPWPYETKKYTYFKAFFDNTMKRFDENTKIIVVEGNIASGKSRLAKYLAEELEMHYMPEASMEQLYILEDGTDFRAIDHLLPKSFKCCDIRTFYENPYHNNVPTFQLYMFRLRFEQYFDALAHLLNTGQGVVLERCVFSDFIFMEVMHKMNYLSKGFQKYYYQMQENSMYELLWPHLVVYLDVPSDILLQRIKERNIPFEVNSKVLTKEYLDNIEYFYKQYYLKQISNNSELIVYDWSYYGDPEVVVEDIERIDFDKYDKYDSKLKEWRETDKWTWNTRRMMFANDKYTYMCQTYYPNWDVPEILATGEDTEEYVKTVNKYFPVMYYQKGYNKYAGDNYFFKTGLNYRDVQKFTLPIYF